MMGLDETLFRFFNITLGSTTLAPVMKVLSDLQSFIPLILIAVLWMVFRDGTRGRVTVLMLILTVTVTDQVSSSVLKPLFRETSPLSSRGGDRGGAYLWCGLLAPRILPVLPRGQHRRSHAGPRPAIPAERSVDPDPRLPRRVQPHLPWGPLSRGCPVRVARGRVSRMGPRGARAKGEARWRTVRGAG